MYKRKQTIAMSAAPGMCVLWHLKSDCTHNKIYIYIYSVAEQQLGVIMSVDRFEIGGVACTTTYIHAYGNILVNIGTCRLHTPYQ